MTQALLFDLDGTLIDSSDDLTRALNTAFAEHGLGALSRKQVESLIGQGASVLMERALRTSGDAILWRTSIFCWPPFHSARTRSTILTGPRRERIDSPSKL